MSKDTQGTAASESAPLEEVLKQVHFFLETASCIAGARDEVRLHAKQAGTALLRFMRDLGIDRAEKPYPPALYAAIASAVIEGDRR